MGEESINRIYVPLVLDADRQTGRLQNRESEPLLVSS